MVEVEKRKIKFVLLGRAVSERIKQGTHTTQCIGGWSEEWGFIRIYPLHPKLKLTTWNEYEVQVERNPKDNRRESWKLQARESLQDMYRCIKSTGKVWTDEIKSMIIPNLVEGCIMNLKDEKAYPGTEIETGRSLGIVKANSGWYCSVDPNKDYDPNIQQDLFGQNIHAKLNFAYNPKYHFRCSKCTVKTLHNCQNLEVGVYEYMRKNRGMEQKILNNWQCTDSNKSDLYLFMGNMNRIRSKYIVISPLKFKNGFIQRPLEPFMR